MFLVPLLSLLGYFLLIKKTTKISDGCVPIITISSIVMLLYFAALLHILFVAIDFICILGIASVIYFLCNWLLSKNYRIDIAEYKIILFSLVIIFILWVAPKSAFFSNWDEFSLWAKVSKFIYLTHSLPDHSSFIEAVFLRYPTGPAIFHAFILKYLGGFFEGGVYFAQNILTIAPLFIVLDKNKSNLFNLTIFLLMIIVIYAVNFGLRIGEFRYIFNNLYNDNLSGLYFAASILIYLKNRNNPLINWLLLPVLSFLILIKETATLFALFAIIFIIIDQLILFKNHLITQPKKKFILGFSIFMLLAGIIFVKLTWIYHCKDFTPININYLSFLSNPHFNDIAQNFFSSLLFVNPSIRPYFTTSLWLYILLGISFYIIKNCHQNKQPLFIRLFIILSIGYFTYALILFILYLTWFSAYEANYLASFNRYIGSYILAYALILTPLIFFYHKKNINFKIALPIIVIACILLVHEFYPTNHKYSLSLKRQEIKNTTNQILSHLSSNLENNKKIYIIYQNPTGFEISIFRYELLPDNDASTQYPSLGKPYSAKDISTHFLAPKELKQILLNYDYILLAKTDKQFWSLYGSVFRPNKPSLIPTFYKIIKLNGKDVKLKKVF